MREEMKKKMEKSNNNQCKSEMQNKQHKRVPYSMMEIHIKSKKHVKKMPRKILKIKQSLCHSFLELILFLTSSVTHCLISNLSQSPSQYS
jgi:hypothetical protein